MAESVLTLGDCKTSREINAVVGKCSTSQEFVDIVNEACRLLLRRGDWSGTVIPIHVCAKRGCVTWPRYVQTVRELNVCRVPVPIFNKWYEFMVGGWRFCSSTFGGLVCSMTEQTTAPTHTDIFGDGRYVRFYATVLADLGKTIQIFGVDNNGQTLRTKNADGTWSEGITLTLAKPFVSTATFVRRIDRVIKQKTNANVYGYAYDPVADVLEDIAVYEPSETKPSYIRYKLQFPLLASNPSTGSATNCAAEHGVVALVKLKFIPVEVDTDVVLIQNIDALKRLIQSIRFGEQGKYTIARNFETDAVRELNLELRNDNPVEQTPVRLQPFGTAIPARHAIGRII